MSELMSQVITPEVQSVIATLVMFCAIIYVLIVVWIARDAYHRGANWWLWAIIGLIPIVGVIAYVLLRPSLLRIDRDEQELEIALKQRQLMKYGECAACGYPVEADYVICPSCHQRLKNLCSNCGKALDPTWSVCPYCATGVSSQRRRAPQPRPRQASAQQPSAAPRPQQAQEPSLPLKPE